MGGSNAPAEPRFGQTAKARILQLASEDTDEPIPASAAAERAAAADVTRRGAACLAAIDPKHRPQVPLQLRPKFPRMARQTVLQRLAGQHLALGAAAAGLPAASAAGDDAVRRAAFEAAAAQEGDLLGQCATLQVYQSRAARLTALDWGRALAERAAEARGAAHTAAAAAEQQQQQQGRQQQGKQRGGKAGTGDRKVAASSTTGKAVAAAEAAAAPNAERAKRARLAPAALEEAELDWAAAEGEVEPEEQRSDPGGTLPSSAHTELSREQPRGQAAASRQQGQRLPSSPRSGQGPVGGAVPEPGAEAARSRPPPAASGGGITVLGAPAPAVALETLPTLEPPLPLGAVSQAAAAAEAAAAEAARSEVAAFCRAELAAAGAGAGPSGDAATAAAAPDAALVHAAAERCAAKVMAARRQGAESGAELLGREGEAIRALAWQYLKYLRGKKQEAA